MKNTPSTHVTEMDALSSIQFQKLLDCMSGGVRLIGVDERLTHVYTSPGYMDLPGSRGGTVDKDPLDCLIAEDRERIEKTIREGALTEAYVECTYRIAADGQTFHRHMRAVRVPYESMDMPVMLCVITDITQATHTAETLAWGSEQLNLALDRMKAQLWEVDIPTATYRLWDAKELRYNDKFKFVGVPGCFTEHNWVYPESVPDITAFFEGMLAGKAEDQCAGVMRQFESNKFSWIKLSYRMHYDQNGKPLKAVGISERFPNILIEKSRFTQEKKLNDAIRHRLIAAVQVNLTRDSVEQCYIGETSLLEGFPLLTAQDMFEENIRTMVNDEDIARYCAKMSPSTIRNAYDHGSDWTMATYRRKDKNGNVRWATLSCVLIAEPVSGDLYGFAYIQDVDRIKRWELSLPVRVERDPETRLYTKNTAHALAQHVLSEASSPNRICAMVAVDFSSLRDVVEKISYSMGSRAILSLGRLFRFLLDEDCVVGRDDDYRFTIFIPSSASRKKAEMLVRDLIDNVERMRDAVSVSEPLSLYVGIAMASCREADAENLYAQAIRACGMAGRSKERIHVYSARTDSETIQSSFSCFDADAECPLTKDESETYARCLAALLKNESYNDATSEMMNVLGEYYNAARVYIVALRQSPGMEEGSREWTAYGKTAALEHARKMSIEKHPAMQRALEEKRIALLGGAAPQETLSKDGVWNLSVIPFLDKDSALGCLCIENAEAHFGETAMLVMLSSVLVAAHRKNVAVATAHNGGQFDRLTGLLNREACMSVVKKTNGDAISALGVFFSDINGLSQVNQEMGMDYGDNLIRFCASTIKGEFRLNEIYRYSGDELLVLCMNITHDEFTKRCESIRRVFDTVYPGRMSIGCTWADSDINMLKMLDHSVKLATLSKQSYYLNEVHGSKHMKSEALRVLLEHLEAKRFRVWFQPKANVSTGEIVGAEALVRLFDPQRGIVGPQEFIPVFERGHAIRELDFFVLNETLRQMQEWKRDGKRIVPVSVNYSRATLLDPKALETTLEIFNRYDVPQNLIEIEITESIGELEHATIARACSQFRKNGFRLALDDFGSAYSSMAVLANVRFDAVKVDKSIINNIVTNNVSRSIVESTLRICNENGADCIAEGVETAEQAEALHEVGNIKAQGYFYNKPLPADVFADEYLKLEEAKA
ncbi:MAG: EAL domain-containing protein [Clostridia bacterium]|nr:EAL domain-containing protein [Clostridia bacterium]